MSAVTLWEDMSELDQLITIYSDQYKEFNGFRPTIDKDITVDQLKESLDLLDRLQDIDEAYERKIEAEIKAEIKAERRARDQAYRDGDTRFSLLKQLK